MLRFFYLLRIRGEFVSNFKPDRTSSDHRRYIDFYRSVNRTIYDCYAPVFYLLNKRVTTGICVRRLDIRWEHDSHRDYWWRFDVGSCAAHERPGRNCRDLARVRHNATK